MTEKDKQVSDWFTKKYGAYNMEWKDWYSSRTDVSKVREMQDRQEERRRASISRRNSDWLIEKHGTPAQGKADWFTEKHGGFRTEIPGWRSAMDPGNLDRIEQMYAKRFGNKRKTKTGDPGPESAGTSADDQTTRKEPV